MAPTPGYLEIRSATDPDQVSLRGFQEQEIGLGRSSGNLILLDAPEISRQHARILWDGNHYVIKDLHSTRGTTVNQLALVPGTPYPLHPDDLIEIGPFSLRFHTQAPLSEPLTRVAQALYDTVSLAEKPRSPILRVTTPQWTRDYPLDQLEIGLGRDPENEICLDMPIVSSHHARIQLIDQGYEIVDLGAINGLICQGQRINQKVLQDGDVLQIGPTVTLTFLISPPVDLVPIAYNCVIKSMKDAVIVLDVEHRIMDLNPAAQMILDCTVEEAVSKSVSWLLTSQPELMQQYQLLTETQPGRVELTYSLPMDFKIDKGGTQHYFDVQISVLHDDRNRLSGYLMVFHETTKQRQAAQELRVSKEVAESYLQALRREMEIGTQIQREFLPQDLPLREHWEFTARFHPARDVSGDFYDFFPLADDCIGLVIGDVSDKGVGSSLFMALFRSLIRVYAEQSYLLALRSLVSEEDQLLTLDPEFEVRLREQAYTAPLKAVSKTNEYIVHNHGNSNMFATLFFGVLDPREGRLTYVNGGHELPFILGADLKVKARLAPTGSAVGWNPNEKFEIRSVQLDPGDIFMAYTDGVTDARTPTGQFFKEKRLITLLESQPAGLSASELLEVVEAEVKAHIATANQFDDITMLAVRRIP